MKEKSELEKTLATGLIWGLKVDELFYPVTDDFGNFVDKDCRFKNEEIVPENIEHVLYSLPKPHLFPTSYLSEEITVNEKTFIPIVELAKIGEPDFFSEVGLNIKGSDRIQGCGFLSKLDKDKAITFVYMVEENSFFLKTQYGLDVYISNQRLLFDKLDEWHFNVRKLTPDQFVNASESKLYE